MGNVGLIEICPELVLNSFPGNCDQKIRLVLSVLVHHEPITYYPVNYFRSEIEKLVFVTNIVNIEHFLSKL